MALRGSLNADVSNMRALIIGICVLPIIGLADTTLWQGQSERRGWFASNQDGFCSLKHYVGAADATLELQFSSSAGSNEQPIFQVLRTSHDLVWPVRVQLGSEWNAPQFEIGADTSSTFLLGQVAQSILKHLKDGGDAHFVYSLTDNVERRVTVGQLGFSQSVAMFEACIAHVA